MPSSVIRSYRYDSASQELLIVFVSGRRYVYSDVPPEKFAAFQRATSRGSFFNREIRDHHPFREIHAHDEHA